MLGPGLVILGTPTALVASLVALRRAPDRVFAIIALVVSSLELGLLGLGCLAFLVI